MLKPIPEYGDHIEIDIFAACCESGGFVDDDGHGFLATEDAMTNHRVCPSDMVVESYVAHAEKEGATHVVWFNK